MRKLTHLPKPLVLLATAAIALVLTPSFVRAADLPTIKQRGRLIVAVKDQLRPLGFRNAAGELTGFEVELARRLAQELIGDPNAVEFRTVSNRDRFQVVLDKSVDLAIAQVTLTPSRLRILSFSLPYYKDGVVIATADPALRTMAQLAGQTIAVLDGSSTVEILRRQVPGAKLIGVKSYQAAQTAIAQGQAIAVAGDASVLAGWVQELPNYRLLPAILSTEPLCIILPKGSQYRELQQRVDQIVARLRNSGWLEQQAQQWGLPIGPR